MSEAGGIVAYFTGNNYMMEESISRRKPYVCFWFFRRCAVLGKGVRLASEKRIA